MIFACRPEEEVLARYAREDEEMGTWRRTFALFPKRVEDNKIVWLERVWARAERRAGHGEDTVNWCWDWEYRRMLE